MKFILAVVLELAVTISLSHGAAVAAISSSSVATGGSSGQNMIMATSGLRSGRQQQEPVVMVDALETNNEPVFRTQPGFPAVFHPGNDYQLKTSGNFAIAYTGVVFWAIAGVLGLAVAIWIVSLFTGLGFFKTILTGFNTFKGRADEMGFKVDSQKLNMMASQVYKAIEAYRVKNQ